MRDGGFCHIQKIGQIANAELVQAECVQNTHPVESPMILRSWSSVLRAHREQSIGKLVHNILVNDFAIAGKTVFLHLKSFLLCDVCMRNISGLRLNLVA